MVVFIKEIFFHYLVCHFMALLVFLDNCRGTLLDLLRVVVVSFIFGLRLIYGVPRKICFVLIDRFT